MKKDNKIVFYFSRGAYFSGELNYCITKINENYIFQLVARNDFHWMENSEFLIPETELLFLYELLQPIKKWKQIYEPPYHALDGYSWEIFFEYEDEKIASSGYEMYPQDFLTVKNTLQKYMEYLGESYNWAYQKSGIDDRAKL